MMRLVLSAAFALAILTDSSAAEPIPIEAFDGRTLNGWKLKDIKRKNWQVAAVSVNEKKPTEFIVGINNSPDGSGSVLASTFSGRDIFTVEKFGDIHLELEFMVPKGSNSGIYLMGEYEVQILDSFGKPDDKLTQGDLGALYSAAKPPKNAAKKPGEWQKFVIDFQAPRFESDKKVANAKFVTVTLNDVVLHENVELKGPTPGGLTGKEAAEGPLMFQGDHGPVAFRNIKITPRK